MGGWWVGYGHKSPTYYPLFNPPATRNTFRSGGVTVAEALLEILCSSPVKTIMRESQSLTNLSLLDIEGKLDGEEENSTGPFTGPRDL